MIRIILPGMLLASSAIAAPESQKLADGLTRTLVAREPLLKNPVALSVDVDGTIYIAETARRKAADLDIREFNDWIPDTLALRSVEERQALYQRIFAPGKNPKSSVKDHNRDGGVDVKDLTTISEKILRLTDENGDGEIETSRVFAENFNTEVTGIAAGVLAWRGDVYASIIPDLWKLRDTKGTGTADKREPILTGFGVHVAYAGHDMHGVCLGPDGKIYWTIGDKGVNVVSKEGKRWLVPDEGSLMRCNPDGSEFEVYASGLRNVQQIAFDDYANIFGVDNDSDAKGEKERFIYIPQDSDTGWRCYYQYRGSDYNPWMDESLSVPSGKDQPAYFMPAICSYVDGPSGFARNPGTALNDRYRGSFFMTSFPAGLLYSFKTERQGAGFRMTDSHVVDKGPAYVGCNFGPDGALYLADWAGGYALKEKGGVWKIDDASEKGSPLRAQVAAMLREGPKDIPDTGLVGRLKHADQRIRCDAQWELARRPSGIPILEKAAATWMEEPVACTHAIWGLTQAKKFSPDLLAKLVTARAENTRAQAAKWAGETAGKDVPALLPLLSDSSPVVRYHAAIAVGKLHMDTALEGVLAMLAENSNRDPFLRHGGVLALVGMKPEAALAAARHSSPSVRLAAAVAFRRQSSPEAASLLDDADPAVSAEAAHAIYDDAGIVPAFPALAAHLDKSPTAPVARRAIASNRRVGDAASANRLIEYAADKDNPSDLRIAALGALASWPEELKLDSVDGRWHPAPAAEQSIARETFTPVSSTLSHDPDAGVAKAATATARSLGIVVSSAQLAADAVDESKPVDARIEALAALKKISPVQFDTIARRMLSVASPAIRAGSANLLEGEASLDYALNAARKSEDTAERQNAIRLLGLSRSSRSDAALKNLAAEFTGEPAVQLEVMEALAQHPALKQEFDSISAALAAREPLGSFRASLSGGNAAKGKQIFENHLAASCTACHRIGEVGSNVGPPLTGVGKKGREFIMTSLVFPQADIAAGYGMKSITKKDGTTISGAPISETADAVSLLQPDGTSVTIPIKEIASQTPAMSAMPPMDSILKASEIRDLVEFLSSTK